MFGLTTLLHLTAFCISDSILTATGLNGVYYIIHAIHNGFIVHSTYNEVYISLTDFNTLSNYAPNYYAAEIVFALHFYHIFYYWRKFRNDDWLHHILMIAIALPIGIAVPSGPLLGFSLFFTTGLPGGIDYFLLFLVRNNWLHRNTEKRINTYLSAWVRAPGCVAVAALITAHISTQNISIYYSALAYLTAALNYWNGVYFTTQVLYDAGVLNVYGPQILPP